MIVFQRVRFFAIVFAIAGCVMVGRAEAAVVSVPITVGESDDAEENINTGEVSITSSDLELGYEITSGGTSIRPQLVGLRFQGVAIPVGATINSAFVTFQVDEVDKGTGPANLNIYGELSPNAVTFSATSGNVSGRTGTSAEMPWNPGSWDGNVGGTEDTSSLTAIVQEIVGQGGWASGNALVIMIEPVNQTGSILDPAPAFARVAEDGDSAGQGAILTVDFTVIPEPSSFLLASLAAVVGFAGRRRSFN